MKPAATSLAALAFALAGLSGCDAFKGREETQAAIAGRVVGMPAGDFFDRYGRAKSRAETADNTATYVWESEVGFVPPGITSLDERVCRLVLVTDKRGRVAEVIVRFDAQGRTSTSRCREIFGAP